MNKKWAVEYDKRFAFMRRLCSVRWLRCTYEWLFVVSLIFSLVIFCCNSVSIQYFKGSKLRKQDFTQRQKLETKKFPFLNSFQILSRGKLKTVFVLFSYYLYHEFSNKEWICIVILGLKSPFFKNSIWSLFKQSSICRLRSRLGR